MADRSHLTAVPTTDKRGRATTVYRNLARRLKPAAVPPVPALPRPAGNGAPADPAAIRPPLTDQQRQAYAEKLYRSLANPPAALRQMILQHRHGGLAAALATGLAHDGTLTEAEADALVVLGATQESPGRDGAVLALNSLRVAARLAHRWPRRPRAWTAELVEAMIGAGVAADTTRPPAALDTDSLDPVAAVVEFTLREPGRNTVTSTQSRYGVNSRRITDPDIEALLRERPHDLDRIIAYVSEHSTRRSSTTDTAALRDWLDTQPA